MPRVRERVLGVELELVDLQLRELLDEPEERGHRRDLVAADVEHDAAGGEVRPVLDPAYGQLVPPLATELHERLAGVKQAGLVMADQLDAVGRDGDAVALRVGDGRGVD